MEASKRARFEQVQSSKEETEPKLKCHEMRLIFRRLPTSELVRFISRQPKHPFGKFWSQELKFIVEKRLPFALKTTEAFNHLDEFSFGHVIFDCNGSRVAEIKRPERFHLSSLCDLIERAEVPAVARTLPTLPALFVFPTPDILSSLNNLDTLALSLHFTARPSLRQGLDDLVTALSPQAMSCINSLTLENASNDTRFNKPFSAILTCATELKKLSMPYYLDAKGSCDLLAALSTGGRSELESLSLLGWTHHLRPQPLLETIRTRCNGLRELFLSVHGAVRDYFVAFHALPNLATLGLAMSQHRDAFSTCSIEVIEKDLAVDDVDMPALSVSTLFVEWNSARGKEPRALLAVLTKFPKVRTFGADFVDKAIGQVDASSAHTASLLQFVSAVCAGGVFRHLESLKLSSDSRKPSVQRDELLQFIRANIDHLPSSVDLSQVETARPTNVDRDFLADLCLALQGGRITSLTLRDLVHRDALSRWWERFALAKREMSGNDGKVLAWVDEGSIDERRVRSRAAWWPKAVSDFTDFRIEGCKTSGPLKGSAFKVRISEWTEKRYNVSLMNN